MANTLKRRSKGGEPHSPSALSGVVRALLERCAPAVWRKIRPQMVTALVDRLVSVTAAPDEFTAWSEGRQFAALAAHAQQVVRSEWEVIVRLDRRFEKLSEMHFGLTSPAERKQLLTEYLREVVTSRAQLRQDLRALDRYLNYDALRERHYLDREARLLFVELSLLALGRAVEWACAEDSGESRVLVIELVSDVRLDAFLGEALSRPERWQNQLASVEALARLGAALARERLSDLADPTALKAAMQLSGDSSAHPWVQCGAAAVILAISSDEAGSLLMGRLLSPRLGEPTDFVVRRLIVDLVARTRRQADGLGILLSLLAHRDPSEHVRIGLCEALPVYALDAAPRAMQALAGLHAEAPEGSPRVRAAAAIGATRGALTALRAKQRELVQAWLEVLFGVLERDRDPFVLEVACEEWAELVEHLTALGAHFPESADADLEDAVEALLGTPLAELAVRPLRAFNALRSNDGHPAHVHEAAAAAAETTLMLTCPQRRAWAHFLRGQLALVAPGSGTNLTHKGLPSLPDDPLWIGRILAMLSRSDWGLLAELRQGGLHLLRGDRFRTRAWRVLHELRTPAPNKRQGFRHTLGRINMGDLRAHPGKLDEVTSTVVPGERVSVDVERGWGRHLPTADDLLDLPILRRRPIFVLSSHGAVRVDAPRSVTKRFLNRLRITLHYPELARLRLRSLAGGEPRERAHYLSTVRARYGIESEWLQYPDANGTPQPISRHATELVPRAERPPASLWLSSLPTLGFDGTLANWADWIHAHSHYFASPARNSQAALALLLGGLSAGWFSVAFVKRREIDQARERIPLSIGGWGTRGKSGTERLKAGLFHGLGFQVFVKTTGCEAMFIHSSPGQTPQEIFIFRPYDKATIWEQAEMVKLGAKVGAEVFLWECMALNPTYVDLLQNDWMRDDLVTLTNAYPDHEDIQGPAGMDVARVISGFIPKNSTLITSEENFLPLFKTVAAARNTQLRAVRPRDGDLIAHDVLELFPYQEHPRNIALVGRMAEELAIEPNLAIYLMSQHVVPDIGVLKTYPDVRLRGRVLRFINGCSANERNGTLSNWRRTRCDRFDLAREPERWVITVVNNRADRISRSEVFARLIVNDVAADRHVFIGTNLTGLTGYVHEALDRLVSEIEVVTAEELSAGQGAPAKAFERLTATLARVRVPEPTTHEILTRLEIYAKGAGMSLPQERQDALAKWLTPSLAAARAELTLDQVLSAVSSDRELASALSAALVPHAYTADVVSLPEVLRPATGEDVTAHFHRLLARVLVHAGLRSALSATDVRAGAINALVGARYRELYLGLIDVIADAGTTGDQVIDRCAQTVPPGIDCTVMGMQNIKGTGLDFVYRWKALDQVCSLLKRIERGKPADRLAALRELEGFEDHGLVDTGLAKAVLAGIPTERIAPDEALLLARTRQRIESIYQRRRADLEATARPSRLSRFLGWCEGWVDYLDSVSRYRESGQVVRDLEGRRIALGRAVLEMRRIYSRQRGGWLARRVLGKKEG